MKKSLAHTQLERDNALASIEQLHRLAFENGSLSGLIYQYNTRRIVQANKAACKLFGQTTDELFKKKYTDLFIGQNEIVQKMQRNLSTTGMSNLVVQRANEKGMMSSYRMKAILFSGETGKRYVKVVLIPAFPPTLVRQSRIEKGTKKESPAQDEQSACEDQSLQNSDWIKYIATTSYDVIWDWDIQTGDIYIGESVQQVLGFFLRNNCVTFNECMQRIPEEEKERVEEKLQEVIASHQLYWNDRFPFIKFDGTVANTMSRASVIRDGDGKALRMIGAMQDVSKLQALEKKLRSQSLREKESNRLGKEKQLELEGKLSDEIHSKEAVIASAVIDAQELQRSELGRELHDNVNQLLGASRLYLDMARTEQGDVSLYISRSEEYTVSAIEAIRELSKDLTTDTISHFGLLAAIDKLVGDTMQTQPVKINYVIDQKLEQRLNLKFKLNIFRIIQEQISNILKHAEAEYVNIQLSQNKFAIILSISDDGLGFNVHQGKSGIGLSNIRSRSATFNGAVTVISQPKEGCTITVIFPLNNILFMPPSFSAPELPRRLKLEKQ